MIFPIIFGIFDPKAKIMAINVDKNKVIGGRTICRIVFNVFRAMESIYVINIIKRQFWP